MTAVADPASPAVAREQDLMVQTPDDKLLYMARRDSLRLIKRPIRQRRDAEGLPVETIPGETLAFKDGILRIPREGDVELADGGVADAAEVIAWLDAHKRHGDVNEGFWRVDPLAPAPSQEELAKLLELATNLDLEGLEAFIAQERDGWDRPALLETAEGAIERIRQMRAAADERAEAQLEAARAEGREEAAAAASANKTDGKGK